MMNQTRDLNSNPALNLSPILIQDQDLFPIVKREAQKFPPLERMRTNADDDCDSD